MKEIKYYRGDILKVTDFYFDLPKELIAQHPTEKRDECKLMALNKKTGDIDHKVFKDNRTS